eukprot:scaffold33473_cov119-Isochrysis_galbana.AAC.2
MVSYRPRSDARYVGSPSALRFHSPKRLGVRFVNQSINQPLSCQSHHMIAILVRLVTRIRTNSVTQTRPVSRAWFSPLSARRSGDVSDRARRRFVSSRFIHFMYNLRFDSLRGGLFCRRTKT